MLLLSKSLQRQAITVFSCNLTCFVFGLAFGWVDPAIKYFSSNASEILTTESDRSWIASVYFVCEILASVAGGMFSSFVGRKPLIIVGTILLNLSWLIMILAKSALVVIISRAILGIAGGIFDITWSIYVGEVTTRKERGIFGAVVIVSFIGGQMMELSLSSCVSFMYLSIIPFVISLFSLGLCYFMVESPPFLITRHKTSEALETLAWLRGKEVAQVQEEFDEMKDYIETVEKKRPHPWDIITSPRENQVYIFCVIIFFLAELTGFVVILSYQTEMLAKYEGIPQDRTLALLFGILIFVFVHVNIFLIETAGRRTLLLIGFFICAIIQSCNAFFNYAHETKTWDFKFIPVIIVALFNFYGVVFMVCVFPTIFVLKSELFPQEMKTIGSVAATISNALAEFIIAKSFYSIRDNYGLSANFIFYAIISIISVIYVYLLIPETKGKSLVQIQKEILQNNSKKKKIEKTTSSS